jgi:1-acyl-sn-glycerol-3-phosphate acyltransferase
MVAASVDTLLSSPHDLHLVVPPEGTRSKTRHWKTGFYWIAHEAGVPIVMAYMDYPRKLSGLGPVFQPTGDIEADMAAIKTYYAQYRGKNWQQFSTD